MVIVIKFFKGATYVDRFNNMYRAKTTFVMRKTPLSHEWEADKQEHLPRAHLSEVVASCLYRANAVAKPIQMVASTIRPLVLILKERI